jgi:acyl-CoA synthetase (AMP-forming)/AMP-acid ligase II/acyl carrier protein
MSATPLNFDFYPSSLFGDLKRVSIAAPPAIAIAAPGRSALTFGQLLVQLEQTAGTLHRLGLGRNDRIAIVLPNGPEMAVAFLAVSTCATSAPLNPAYRESEFDFYLSDLNAKALILLSDVDSPARAVAAARGIPIIELAPDLSAPAGIFALHGRPSSPRHGSEFAQAEDAALVLHTSGTTSRPKIVPLTQRNLCSSAQHIRTTLQLQGSDRCLNVMPLFHIHGLIGATLSSLTAGASVVCTPGFNAPQFFDWLREFRPTWYTAVPTMHQAILARAEGAREILAQSRLRFIRSSSAALAPQIMAELEKVFRAPVIESYGMTEAAHQMASNPLPPRARKPGSVGLAAGPEVGIMNEQGHLLPAGEIAEIVVRGPNLTPGYESNPAANQAGFTKGWFRTGDQGYLDAEGYLFLTGRIKELINRGGEKISPREIDEVLLDHPAVAQAVAFAIPDKRLGEEVAAAVVLRENLGLTEKALREFAATRLADFKVPKRVVILDQIPKGPTGKLQRIGLAEKLGLTIENTARPRPEYTPPRTLLEEELAAIWSQVLRVEKIGAHDNFLDLGGDSVLAAQVVAQVADQLGVQWSLLQFFEKPTLAGVAEQVSQIRLNLTDEMAREFAAIENLSEAEIQKLLAQERPAPRSNTDLNGQTKPIL